MIKELFLKLFFVGFASGAILLGNENLEERTPKTPLPKFVPFIIAKSISPDGKLALGVLSDRSEADLLDEMPEHEGIAYLVDAKTKRILQPLEEVYTDGGIYGRTIENVGAEWSRYGGFVIIYQRTGRLLGDYSLYKVVGQRLEREILPTPDTHPKGAIYDFLDSSSNGYNGIEWISSTRICQLESWNWRPKKEYDWEQVASEAFKLGLIKNKEKAEKIFPCPIKHFYTLKKGKWILEDIQLAPEK